MKQLLLILSIQCLLTQTRINAQSKDMIAGENESEETRVLKPGKQTNFFIISRRKKGKLDLATRYNVVRTRIRSYFHHKKFIVIVARDADHMSRRVRNWLNKKHSALGTIWFDSHGQYKKGYSLFTIGTSEISHKTLRDSTMTEPFRNLSPYTGNFTKVVIGSCYGGATYERASVDYTDTTRMNGDSLMIALGHILKNGIVYGSESWVMSKPGLFKRQPAVGGNPGRKLFLDICYEPAWKTVGSWNQYVVTEKKFGPVNTIALDRTGNLVIRGLPYKIEKKTGKNIQLKLSQLSPGLYK